jgi:hypothetical protein
MKNNMTIINWAVSAVVAILMAGCSTSERREALENTVRETAAEGTAAVLAERPEWRGAFEEAAEDLATLAAMEEIDGAVLWRIVDRLPVRELQGERALIYVTGTRVILERLGIGEIPIDRGKRLRGIVRALAEGVGGGLERAG